MKLYTATIKYTLKGCQSYKLGFLVIYATNKKETSITCIRFLNIIHDEAIDSIISMEIKEDDKYNTIPEQLGLEIKSSLNTPEVIFSNIWDQINTFGESSLTYKVKIKNGKKR